MTKQPTRGHISVKGPTYLAFREACEPANRTMGRVLDELIVATLDDDQVETAHWAKWRADRLEAIKTKTWDRAQAKKKADECRYREREYEPGNPLGVVPEQVIASFYHTFGKPTADPYHVEVTPKRTFNPPNKGGIFPTQPLKPAGLFSEQGIADAELEAKTAKAEPKRKAKGTEPPPFHEIKSCIDPTFGKK